MKSILDNRPELARQVANVAEVAGYLWQKINELEPLIPDPVEPEITDENGNSPSDEDDDDASQMKLF